MTNYAFQNDIFGAPTFVVNGNLFWGQDRLEYALDELKNLTNIAFQNDVFGAPTFVVNNNLFWGQDRLDYALDELNN